MLPCGLLGIPLKLCIKHSVLPHALHGIRHYQGLTEQVRSVILVGGRPRRLLKIKRRIRFLHGIVAIGVTSYRELIGTNDDGLFYNFNGACVCVHVGPLAPRHDVRADIIDEMDAAKGRASDIHGIIGVDFGGRGEGSGEIQVEYTIHFIVGKRDHLVVSVA